MTSTRHYVVKPAGDGLPRVERAVRWRLIGAVERDLTPEELRDEFMFELRDAGVGPEPILSFSTADDGAQTPHLDWPDLGTHVLDPEYARLLTLASLPLFRSCPELDDGPEPDLEAIAAAEHEIAEDRERQSLIVRLIAELAPEVALKGRRERRARKRARVPEREPTKGPPKPSPSIFEGERTASGWRWSRPRSRLQLRARWRR